MVRVWVRSREINVLTMIVVQRCVCVCVLMLMFHPQHFIRTPPHTRRTREKKSVEDLKKKQVINRLILQIN